MRLKRLPICFMGLLCLSLTVIAMAGTALTNASANGPAGSTTNSTQRYVLAAPRAALITPQVINPANAPLRFGAAENFPRAYGNLHVRPGHRVVFGLSREIEGVWYAQSYGILGTSLELQWCRYCKVICDCPNEVADLPVVRDQTDSPLPARTAGWVTIGKDGARAVRHGPSIGHANVGIPVRFLRPGVYWLRGIVTTYAQPLIPDIDVDPAVVTMPAGDKDRDIVYVRVVVVDWAQTIPDPATTTPDPNAQAEDLPQDDEGAPVVTDSEINGDSLTIWTQ